VPGLNIIPPDAKANPATIKMVRTAAMIPNVEKKPNWVFFINTFTYFNNVA
jgi:hypothetical protein